MTALMEQRIGAGEASPRRGYVNAAVADKDLLRGAYDRVLTDVNYGVARAGFTAYEDGSCLMAIARYALTGGPELPDRPTIRQAMDILTNRTLGAQQTQGPEIGYWGYTGPGNDSSTTQFAMAGLGAARTWYIQQPDQAAFDQVVAIAEPSR